MVTLVSLSQVSKTTSPEPEMNHATLFTFPVMSTWRDLRTSTKLVKYAEILIQFFFTESLYRQCLPDGSWFSCLSLQDDISTTTTGTGNENKVGWTNYSLCWTASTQKIMEDLNQKAGCPDEASEEAKEVRTKISDLLKKKL